MPVLQIVNTRRHQKTGCKEGAGADFLWISPFCSLVLLPFNTYFCCCFYRKNAQAALWDILDRCRGTSKIMCRQM